MANYIDKEGTLARLEICRNEDQWEKVCRSVRLADPTGMGQYPDWWYAEVVESGLGDKKVAEFQSRPPPLNPVDGWGQPILPERQRPPEGTRDIDWED